MRRRLSGAEAKHCSVQRATDLILLRDLVFFAHTAEVVWVKKRGLLLPLYLCP